MNAIYCRGDDVHIKAPAHGRVSTFRSVLPLRASSAAASTCARSYRSLDRSHRDLTAAVCLRTRSTVVDVSRRGYAVTGGHKPLQVLFT